MVQTCCFARFYILYGAHDSFRRSKSRFLYINLICIFAAFRRKQTAKPFNPDNIASFMAQSDEGLSMTNSAAQKEERDLWPALRRGFRRKCPNCGSGPMLKAYLKVRDTCPVCRQNLSHHRADDGPAYLTILIVGHLMAPSLLFAFIHFRPDPLVLFTIFAIGCTTLSLYLLPRLKGAVVAFQWARRMYGFGE